jgi:D-amino peptidase
MVQGAQPGIAGIVYIGYHAAAATIAGILDHSYFGAQVHEMRLNGETCSESRLNSAVVGEMGIPAICLSGDQSACADAVRFMPWITTVTVKTALGRTAAMSLSPSAARDAIRSGVATAVSRLATNAFSPYLPDRPMTLDISLLTSERADVAAVIPGVARIDGTTVRYVADSAETIYRAAETIMRVASTVA